MKKKLTIQDLEVKSFVTNLSKKENETVKGGDFTIFGWCTEDCFFLPQASEQIGCSDFLVCNPEEEFGTR